MESGPDAPQIFRGGGGDNFSLFIVNIWCIEKNKNNGKVCQSVLDESINFVFVYLQRT